MKAKDKYIEGLRADTERMLMNSHLDATTSQFWAAIFETNYDRASQVIGAPGARNQGIFVHTKEAMA